MAEHQSGGFRMRPRVPVPEVPKGTQDPVTSRGPRTPPESPREPTAQEKPGSRSVDARNGNSGLSNNADPRLDHRRERERPTTSGNSGGTSSNAHRRPEDPRRRPKDYVDFFHYSGLGKLSAEAITIMEWNTAFSKNSPDLREFFKRCLEYHIWKNCDKEGRIEHLTSIRHRLRRNEETVNDVERRPSQGWLASLLAIRARDPEVAAITPFSDVIVEERRPPPSHPYNDRQELQHFPNPIPPQEHRSPAGGPSSPAHDQSGSDMEIEEEEEDCNPVPIQTPLVLPADKHLSQSPNNSSASMSGGAPSMIEDRGEDKRQTESRASLDRHQLYSPAEAPSIPSDSPPAPISSSTSGRPSHHNEDKENQNDVHHVNDQSPMKAIEQSHRKRRHSPSPPRHQQPPEEGAFSTPPTQSDKPQLELIHLNEGIVSCVFCLALDHSSVHCTAYHTWESREYIRQARNLCWHCLGHFDVRVCNAESHRKKCTNCHVPHFAHPAFCKYLNMPTLIGLSRVNDQKTAENPKQ